MRCSRRSCAGHARRARARALARRDHHGRGLRTGRARTRSWRATYLPNNHELFSLLAWATTTVAGESEIALRVWSVVPFLAGVALVTAWLHVRVGALSGVLFLFLATGSPLLLDITPTARGYGLAFLAMSIVVVAALEADRSGRSCLDRRTRRGRSRRHVDAAELRDRVLRDRGGAAVRPELRGESSSGSAAAALALVAWYAPHLGSVFANSGRATASRSTWPVSSPHRSTTSCCRRCSGTTASSPPTASGLGPGRRAGDRRDGVEPTARSQTVRRPFSLRACSRRCSRSGTCI